MANRERGELTLVAGEQTYTLRLTTNACCELEDFADRTWDQVLVGINRGSYKDVRLMFWVALRDHHPDIATLDRSCLPTVGTLIDDAGGLDAIHARLQVLARLNADDLPAPPEGGDVSRPPDAQPKRIGDNSTLTH